MNAKANETQIIWNGCDGYEIADGLNSYEPEWPVNGNDGKWHYQAFVEQRVLRDSRELHLGFLAVEISESDVPRDADGELNFEGLYAAGDRVFKTKQ